MKLLRSLLAIVLFISAGLPGTQSRAEDRELQDLFASMLTENMKSADLVAHIEVTGIAAETRRGIYQRYRIDSRLVRSFKGPATPNPVFYWWVEEDLKRDVIGEHIIVTLVRDARDRNYYIPDNGHSFPASAALLKIAEDATGVDRGD